MNRKTAANETISAVSYNRLLAAIDVLSVAIRSTLLPPNACIEKRLISQDHWIEDRVIYIDEDTYDEEIIHVAVVQEAGSSAKIEWTPRNDDVLTVVGVGLCLFHRSDLKGYALWHDWCEATGDAGLLDLAECWVDFADTRPQPFIRNFNVQVSGDLYLTCPEVSR